MPRYSSQLGTRIIPASSPQAKGSVLVFLAYFTLLRTRTVTSLSFITVFTPVVALLLGFVFNERPTRFTAIGTILIPAGVAVALTEQRAVGRRRAAVDSQQWAAGSRE